MTVSDHVAGAAICGGVSAGTIYLYGLTQKDEKGYIKWAAVWPAIFGGFTGLVIGKNNPIALSVASATYITLTMSLLKASTIG